MGKNFVHNTGGEVGDIFGFVTDFVTGLCYNETSTKKRPKRTYKMVISTKRGTKREENNKLL